MGRRGGGGGKDMEGIEGREMITRIWYKIIFKTKQQQKQRKKETEDSNQKCKNLKYLNALCLKHRNIELFGGGTPRRTKKHWVLNTWGWIPGSCRLLPTGAGRILC